jgi:peptide/nickel transport system substrate-binding protein
MSRNRFSMVIGLLVAVTMVLAACTPATSTPATTVPVQPTTAPGVPTTAPVVPTETPKTTRTGGWLDQIVFTAIPDANSGIAQLQAGSIDMFLNSSLTDANLFAKVKADTNLNYNSLYGSSDQLLFNTVDCTSKGMLNPFNDMAIREAMNWAVDRNYVAQEIAGGLATPMFTALDPAFPDAARNAGELGAIATKYAYDLSKAQAVVDAEMPKLGATKDASGKWQYKGKPVTVIGLIRTEDSRKQIGEYFANQLEKLGFTVDRQEKVRKEASPIWAQGDPNDCKFNYYTAGWINTAIIRDEGGNFATFNSGDVQQIPAMIAYQASPALKKVDDALLTNNFKTMDERAQLFKTALDLSMTESWWGIWVIAPFAFEPSNTTLSAASDLAAGQSNALLPYTLRYNDKEGGTIHIAQSGIMVDPWNPINGSNWTDDATVQYMTSDHGTVPNPYTGLSTPKLITHGEVIAKTGLPIAKSLDWVDLKFQDTITVPDDAWADWNATTQTFITAKDRAAAAVANPTGPDAKYTQTANTQVTVTYTPDLFKTKWHDGSNFSVADVIMAMIMQFDPAKTDSKIYDEGAVSTLQVFMSHFKGVKIDSTNPLTITTWDDSYSLDAENSIAGLNTWYPGIKDVYAYGTGAWHNIGLSIQAEADGKIAMSADKSSTLKVDRTGMISGPTLAVMASYLDQDIASGYIPYAPTLGTYITADEAKTRYTNLQTFYKAHGVLWIGTGPYYIDKVDSTAGSITLARFADYLFPSDQFSGFGVAEIAVATVDGPTTVKAGDAVMFNVSVTFNNLPYPSKDLDSVTYTLFGADGSTVASGTATMSAEGQYIIALSTDTSSKLVAGPTSMSVAVASKTVGMPTFVSYQFVVTK